jgi:hypothetical protein
LDWIRERPLAEEKISPEDLRLLTITDDIDEACDAITRHRRSRARLAEERAAQEETAEAMQAAAGGGAEPRPP